jgi:membrane protein implicated in regulation of membrane protease activity
MNKNFLIIFFIATIVVSVVIIFYADPFIQVLFAMFMSVVILFLLIRTFSGRSARKRGKKMHHNKWAERVREQLEEEKQKDFDKK